MAIAIPPLQTLKLPLLFGKSYLIKMAKASKILIKTQTLEPVSTESERYLLFGEKMQKPMTEKILYINFAMCMHFTRHI
jgi:hypothetical protein